MVSKITKAKDEKSSEPRRCHPRLSLVSKHFRSIVASPDLYARRSLLACTESCLYVVLNDKNLCRYRWYILFRKANGIHCLVRAPSFPFLFCPESSVAVGSRIYLFSGINEKKMTTDALSMDCISHTVEHIPSIPVPLVCEFADFIDGKIYVIGWIYHDPKNVMVVFDIETQKWEHAMSNPEMDASRITSDACVVMADKIYIKNCHRTYVYDPKESKWETDHMLNCMHWVNACVIDDVLYYHDRGVVDTLRAYDPFQKSWGVVEGVKELLAKTSGSQWSRTVNYGGNIALIFSRIYTIWCAEISLEKRQGGEIWGKVEWCDPVLTGNFEIRKCLADTV